MHLKECKQLQEFLQLKVIEECLKQLHHVVYIFRSKYQKKITSSQRENEEVFLHAEKEAFLSQRQAASKVHLKPKP